MTSEDKKARRKIDDLLKTIVVDHYGGNYVEALADMRASSNFDQFLDLAFERIKKCPSNHKNS